MSPGVAAETSEREKDHKQGRGDGVLEHCFTQLWLNILAFGHHKV
jgi:hypothetical protein